MDRFLLQARRWRTDLLRFADPSSRGELIFSFFSAASILWYPGMVDGAAAVGVVVCFFLMWGVLPFLFFCGVFACTEYLCDTVR